ncbi:C40 family peptidase [Mycolicibacterium sp. XJ1819]
MAGAPDAVVTALAAPIRRLQAAVGTGWSADPFADPAAVLGRVRDGLADVSARIGRTWFAAEAQWSGAGAQGAAGFMARTVAALDDLAAHADRLSSTAGTAAEAIMRAHDRLTAIVEDFEARAAALAPHLDSPAVAEKLLAEARRALAEATAVVDALHADLDGHAAALTTAAPSAPAATAPAGVGGVGPMPALGSGLGGGASGSAGAPGAGLGTLIGDLVGLSTRDAPDALADPAGFGSGVAVRLPDGSSAMAPNAVAASAVRHALTQLGVPYQWGGVTPGVGLDCSGLTKWAYGEAGLNIPRLAQEQDVGAAVDAGSLRPGDLAVWDGHVAMVVGNGTMIEAGDPVKLSPIRTDNAGQGFQGFWRPTA